MTTRRRFLKIGVLGSVASGSLVTACAQQPVAGALNKPVVISTWEHGLPANDAAWTILAQGGRALDAVEAGVRVVESDPSSQPVGYGGRPDRNCPVTPAPGPLLRPQTAVTGSRTSRAGPVRSAVRYWPIRASK